METSAMVIVFTLIMLVKREDLRNRLIRLAGQGQLNVVTQALDDGSRRLSRYLMLQFLMNATYGLLFGCGAYWIGLPHALLWGVLSGLLRFIPYVGTPVAAAFPTGMALAVFPGWQRAVFVVGLFLVLELVLANLIEPWLYGSHTGISSLAILVATVFWAILWGPVGLILSTPLTVCLILIGRYVPQLTFLEVLLGDEPVLSVEAHFYQRLLALDQEEASGVAETYLRQKPIGDFFDFVLIPALTLAERDRHLETLEPSAAAFVSQNTRELIEELGERPSGRDQVLFSRDESNGNEFEQTVLSGLELVCIPAGDEADELVAMMLAQLLKRLGCEVRQLPIASNPKRAEDDAADVSPIAVVSALPPFAVSPARSLCRLLRKHHPGRRVILGLWGFEGGVERAQDRLGPACADSVVTSLHEVILLLIETKDQNEQSTTQRANDAIQRETIATGT
jgi:hypothetical protein